MVWVHLFSGRTTKTINASIARTTFVGDFQDLRPSSEPGKPDINQRVSLFVYGNVEKNLGFAVWDKRNPFETGGPRRKRT